MIKKEAQFTIRFRHWIKANPMPSGAFELKSTRGENRFPFRELQEHQEQALLASKSKEGLFFKIPDIGVAYNPFDCFYLRNAYAWVVIEYPQGFVIIDIDNFILARSKTKEKSLTWARAQEISHQTIRKNR